MDYDMKATFYIRETKQADTPHTIKKTGGFLGTTHYYGKLWGVHSIENALHQKVINLDEETPAAWLAGLGYTVVTPD